MDYKKKSLNKLNQKESYEEIDTRLASGWYVDAVDNKKKKKYKTEKVSFKISKKIQFSNFLYFIEDLIWNKISKKFDCIALKSGTNLPVMQSLILDFVCLNTLS